MKKIYFSLVAAGLSLTAFGQVKSTAGMKTADSRRVATAGAVSVSAPTKPVAHASTAKAAYLTETFDGTFPPTGWDTLSGSASTTSDPGQDWQKRVNGGYPENTNALNGTSPGACAAIIWVNATSVHDQYLYTPEVTLAAAGAYRMVFDFASSPYWHSADVMFDNADITISASIDGGDTWGPILWQEDSAALLEASNSQGWLDLDPYIWSRAYMDISEFAGEDVMFAFHYLGQDGAPFFLDNVIIEDIPENDLAALKGWSGNIATAFEYYATPLAQAIPMEVGVVLRNQGATAQTAASIGVVIKRGATQVYAGSAPIDLDLSETDTLWVPTGYTPDAAGTYTVTFTVPADEFGDNDVIVVDFEVTENVYAHDHPSESIFRFDRDEVVSMGNIFQIHEDATLHGVDIKFEEGTTENLFTQINVLQLPASGSVQGSEVLLIGGLDGYTVPASVIATGNYTSIMLENPVVLLAGNSYIVEIRKLDQGVERLFLGGSNEGDDDNSTVCFGPFGENELVERFIGWGFAPAVRMNFDETLKIDEKEANAFGLNVYPNPATSDVNVAFNLNNESEVSVSVTDLTGKVISVNNLGTQTAGAHKVNLDTQAFAKGVYVVKFTANNVVSTQRLVIR